MLGEGIDREFGIDMYTLLYLFIYFHTAVFKMDNQQGPTVYHRNSTQYCVAAWMEGEFGGEWTDVCVWLSLFAVHLKLS